MDVLGPFLTAHASACCELPAGLRCPCQMSRLTFLLHSQDYDSVAKQSSQGCQPLVEVHSNQDLQIKW